MDFENMTKKQLTNQFFKEMCFYCDGTDELYDCCRILVKLVPKKIYNKGYLQIL